MPGIALFGRLHRKPDGAAIGVGGRFAVDGQGNAKTAGGAAVEIAVAVGNPWANAQRAEQRIVKLARGFKIFDTDHHMTEHSCLR